MAESFSNYEGIQDNHQEEGKKIKTDQTLGSILNVQLNVENINTYADDAFNNLVAFAGQKVSDYKKITSIEGLSDKEIEDKAFKYYEIGDINSILDFIAEKAQEIRGLDGIIDRAANLKIVVVQPDAITPNLATGNGEFKEKKMIDRLKTVLFILKEDFDVDVNDEQQLSIEKGVIGDNMMRKTSYYLVNAPTIDRTLLICDEEGNASYVFNSKVLKEKEISNNQLIHFTKSELNDLIEETPELGRRVVYTKDGFVPRMIGSINNPVSTIPDEILPKSKDSASYLYPKASEGYLTAGAFARKNNIHPRTVSSVLDIIKDQLGNVEIYKSKNGLLSQGFSLEQQEIIFKQLEKEGKLIKPEPAPEGYFSKETLAKENNTSAETLSVVIDNIKSQLGYIGKYRFKNMDVLGYSPEQQKIIIDQLNKVVPEGYLSIKNIAEKYGTNSNIVNKAIETVRDQLGEIGIYKFAHKNTFGLSPKQQEIVLKELEKRGILNEIVPEGYSSIEQIAQENNFSKDMVYMAVNAIKEKLGGISKYRFNRKINTSGFSPEQQKMIVDHLGRSGKSNGLAPEGYLSVRGFTEKYNISSDIIFRVVKAIKDQLGDVNIYMFGTKNTLGYSPEQQEIIMDYVKNHPKKTWKNHSN